MHNHLYDQTSPYLLQHAENPVDWYPWCAEAFEKARSEDKPIFLSIGYSTCHWCHVMAHESFEDAEIADILNQFFVSIKVDKEERPDIDRIYMTFCLAFTGSGGWPTTIFMTPEQKPFFAGTYFPKTARYGSVGLKALLLTVQDKWQHDRASLLRSADEIVRALHPDTSDTSDADETLLKEAVEQNKRRYDGPFGGFGISPKFPMPHNLLFLMQYHQKHGDAAALEMAERTLLQMYRGGLFDHIGYGFCRYSTDRYFQIPHFEKMLYDNALLIMAYCKAYEITGKPFYKRAAEQTAAYVQSEMTSPDGGFYSAQDADSDGEEGRYYTFTPAEITALLGEADGAAFCAYYGITAEGNFGGKSMPNLLHTAELSDRFDAYLPKIRAYRKKRARLHTDDKILTAWNGLMIAALCFLYRISRNGEYLRAAKKAQAMIETMRCASDTLCVSYRNGKRGPAGFLDDYAAFIFALLALYDVTLDRTFLDRAKQWTAKTVTDFYDRENGGFYFSGAENERLILQPKACDDGALPSGNALMTYNLVRLFLLDPAESDETLLRQQLAFMAGQAKADPAGCTAFLIALSDWLEPPDTITAVGQSEWTELPFHVASDCVVRVEPPTEAHPMRDGQPTVYCCTNRRCLPPMNKSEFYAHNNANQHFREENEHGQ